MLTFDLPVPFSTFGRRNVSNVPAQSLTLMNDPFVAQQAGHWARKIIAQTNEEDERIRSIYLSAFSREPTPDEMETARSFLAEQTVLYVNEPSELQEVKIWSDLCHSVINMKAFIYLT